MEPEIIDPVDGAAVNPADPDQSEVSQDPETIVVGDVETMPVVGA